MKNLFIIALLLSLSASVTAQVYDRNVIKSWFRTGYKPTQEQYWHWMDSYWHKYDSIPANMISGLPESNTNYNFDSAFEANFNPQPLNHDATLTGNSYDTRNPVFLGADTLNYIATKNDLLNIPAPPAVDTNGTQWAASKILYGDYTGTEGTYYLIWNHVTGSQFAAHQQQIMHIVGGTPDYDVATVGDLITIAPAEDSLSAVYQLRDTGWTLIKQYVSQGGDYVRSSLTIGTLNYAPLYLRTKGTTRLKFGNDGRAYWYKFKNVGKRNFLYIKDTATGEMSVDYFDLATKYVDSMYIASSHVYYRVNGVIYDAGVVSGGGAGGNPDSMHSHRWDWYLDRANHTGAQPASTISDFNSTGDARWLQLSNFNSVFDTRFGTKTTDNLPEGSTNKYWSNTLFDTRFASKFTGTGYAKYASGVLNYVTAIPVTDINATGTPSSSTYLRGDGQWTAPSFSLSGGATNRMAYWTSATALSNVDSIFIDNSSINKPRIGFGIAPIATLVIDSARSATAGAQPGGGFLMLNSTDPINYVRFRFYTGGGSLYIKPEAGGTASPGFVYIGGTGNTTYVRNDNAFFAPSGNFSGAVSASTITASTSVTSSIYAAPSNSSLILANGFYNNTSGNINGAALVGRVGQSLSAGYTGFLISPWLQSKGSGTYNLLRVSTNTNATGSGTETLALKIADDYVTTLYRPPAFSGSTPSYTLGAGAGTGATASITGNDAAGYITITTGTTPTAGGDVITITFNTALSNTPTSIQLRSCNEAAVVNGSLLYPDQASAGTSSYKIKNISTTALPASTTLKFYYTTTQ